MKHPNDWPNLLFWGLLSLVLIAGLLLWTRAVVKNNDPPFCCTDPRDTLHRSI